MTESAYLRFPHVHGDQVAFVAENDIWLVGADGGRAYRVSADQVPVKSPRISPLGSSVAWTATRGGANEVYVAPVDGGVSRRLTFWGQDRTFVRGWLSESEVLVLSTTGQAERARIFAHAVPVDGSPARRLPYGWAHDLALGPDGGALLSTSTTAEPAWWKHYRGGTAAQLWLDVAGDGEFARILTGLTSSLVSPVWVGDRIGFLSDHEGRGQLYTLPVDGAGVAEVGDLTRHTDGEFYARHATSDGTRVAYVAGGRLWLLDSLQDSPRQVPVQLGGARAATQPRFVKAGDDLAVVAPDHTGRLSVIESRGTITAVSHRDGPARTVAGGSGVRYRLPTVLGRTGRVAYVSDADGDDMIVSADLASDDNPVTVLPAGQAGRVLETAASPDGAKLAVATHDGRLLVLDTVGDAAPILLAHSEFSDYADLSWSPDSAWLAWAAPSTNELRKIQLAEVAGGADGVLDVTDLRFRDTEPVFTPDGKYLAFLSVRSFDPVYDSYSFDLSFPSGCRPYLVALAALTPAPFGPRVDGRGWDEPAAGQPDEKASETTVPVTVVDREGIGQRLIPLPVEGSRYEQLRAVDGGLVWLKRPPAGELGENLAGPDDGADATVERFGYATGKVEVLADSADRVEVSGDGKRLVLVDSGKVTVLPASGKVDKDSPDRVEVDLDRVRIEVQPVAEWTQMYHEAWRLMRDHFWRADMGGVDWEGMRRRYQELLPRLASHDDLVDLIWELNGELGTSHAYCNPKPSTEKHPKQGLLGADLSWNGQVWVIDRIVPGEASDRRARSPLAAAGVGAAAGDALLAINGQRLSAEVSPNRLLLGAADRPVELLLAPAGGTPRRVVVVPLADEMPLRYQDWVASRRSLVRAATGGRVGYVHVPDMVSGGWAQLHRDLPTEVDKDGLIVDVRGNRGGHTSQLVVEKLARRIIGWDVNRQYAPMSYPQEARRGPMVAVTDMHAGSDGDIVTAAIQSLELGPVVGSRTWGGVIGIDGRYQLIDGTSVTQPRYSFWFSKFGWGVENHGVQPDVEVIPSPQDRVSGADPELERAVAILLEAMAAQPPLRAPELPPTVLPDV